MIFKKISRDIKYKVVLSLLLGSSIVFGLFFVYNYNQNKNYLESKLNKNLERTITRLSENLVVPLWELDEKWIEMIANTEMLAPEMEAISITGDGGLNIYKKRSNNGDVIETSSLEGISNIIFEDSLPIIRDSDKIGEVTVYISNKVLETELIKEVISSIRLALLLIVFVSLASFLILDYFILKPLNEILVTVKGSGINHYSMKVNLDQEDQIGELAKEFNTMMENILSKEEMMLSQSRQAAMGEMISMIAHQWRQPITVIAMGANNMLLEAELDNLEPESVKDSAKKMLKQTVHLSKTIDDFRNFFSPNKSKELVKITDIVEENLQVIGKSLENNNVEVEKDFKSETSVFIYSRELLQVLINIFKNAKEALVENKIYNAKISIITREDEAQVYISICDNGKGIPDKIINRIFEPYFTTKSEKNGTGLGLYMSKTIIDKHFHGKLTAENMESGGACFKISIPKVQNENI